MAEDQNPHNEQPNNEDVSPSALFLEMMRQAARKADLEKEPAPKPPTLPNFESLPEIPPAPAVPVPSPIEETPAQADFAPFDANELASPNLEAFPEETLYEDSRAIHTRPELLEPKFPESAEPSPVAESIQHERIPIYQAEGLSADDDQAAKLEEQRIKRLKRRKERQQVRRVGFFGGLFRTLFVAIFASALSATIFTWFTAPEFIRPDVANNLQNAAFTESAPLAPFMPSPTVLRVTPNYLQRIGIVSGHRGPENDPGAVCPDGLTEAEITFQVAQQVVADLQTRGYIVDLLDEFDPRLENYRASALVSIHVNDCRDYGGNVSAYLIARAASRPEGGLDDRLAECVALYYGRNTGLERRFTLTIDMTDYHSFREIHPDTPAAIIELGFLRGDRELLTQGQALITQGIVEGVQCFLKGENPLAVSSPTPLVTAIPSSTP